jgi:hypothetical protein
MCKSAQVNGKGTLLTAVLLALGASLPASTVKLPALARQVDRDPESQIVAASMTINGVAFAKVADGRVGQPLVVKEWPTLDALAVGGGRFILADRFGGLRLVGVRETAGGIVEADLLAQWPCEGLPSGLAVAGSTLFVASASAGVMVFEWDGETTTRPHLVARYPFVDYSKQIALHPSGIVLLADNHDTGLQILSFRERRELRNLATIQSNFVDGVALAGNTLAMVDRHAGARIVNIAEPGNPIILHTVQHLPPKGRGTDIKSVAFSPNGLLLIGEGPAGAQVVRLTVAPDGSPSSSVVWKSTSTGVLDGLFLAENELLLSLSTGGLQLIRILDNP